MPRMIFRRTLQGLRQYWTRGRRTRRPGKSSPRLLLEQLEDRTLPAVHALFGLDTLAAGPFPSNRFTVADASHNTGRRINLPLPDLATRPSDYQDVQVLNTLDGFNLQPRLSIPFSEPIDVSSVSSDTVFLIRLGDTLGPHDRRAGLRQRPEVVGINQTVWDVATNTLHVESDELLDQHTRYALVGRHGLRDASGALVEASPAFRRFLHGPLPRPERELRGYRRELRDGVRAARRLGIRGQDIVTASVFTTQSVTAVLEKVRDQIKAATPEPADFLLGPGGTRTVFPLDQVTSITWDQQTRVDPPGFTIVPVNLGLLGILPGAVGQVAFGEYRAPDYEVHPGEFIPPVGTRTGTPIVQGINEIYFNLYLPAGPKPEGGWPVAIHGHSGGDSNQGRSSLSPVATLASHGIATITINSVGHGSGPLSTLTVSQAAAGPVTFPAGGRGIDQNGDGVIGNQEGFTAAGPRTIIGNRDGFRQTAVDIMQLVRVIEVGMDFDGDGVRDLDPSRIYHRGQSQGGNWGALLLAVEPAVRVSALSDFAGSTEARRLSAENRPGFGRLLQSRTPSLINPPGLTSIGGVAVGGPHFDENMPLRNQPPLVNTVPGAMEIQQVIENTEWVSQSGSPPAYAPYLRKSPLSGVPAKSVILVFAKGDQQAVNPVNAAILRAGDLADRATFYRHDLAFAENPDLPRNPHTFPGAVDSTIPLYAAIARGVQEQIAAFLASDGGVIVRPEPSRFFEVPIVGPLPEDLNYIP